MTSPIDPELFARTAPAWNCVADPGEGLHYLAADGSCRWCGMTKQQIAAEQGKRLARSGQETR